MNDNTKQSKTRFYNLNKKFSSLKVRYKLNQPEGLTYGDPNNYIIYEKSSKLGP